MPQLSWTVKLGLVLLVLAALGCGAETGEDPTVRSYTQVETDALVSMCLEGAPGGLQPLVEEELGRLLGEEEVEDLVARACACTIERIKAELPVDRVIRIDGTLTERGADQANEIAVECAYEVGGEFPPREPEAASEPPPEPGEPPPPEQPPEPETTKPEVKDAVVARAIDGDIIELKNGRRVRLLQIDSPEPIEGECYSQRSAQALARMLPPGTSVLLEFDPGLDDVDEFDRLLAYVHKGEVNVNLQLVKRGAASVWFFEGNEGIYAEVLDQAARQARQSDRGLWGACPGTEYDPTQAVVTAK